MIPLPSFRGKTVGVLGLGPEGTAAAEALIESGANVFAWDAEPERQSLDLGQVEPIENWPIEAMSTVVLADGSRMGLSRDVVIKAQQHEVQILSVLDLLSAGINALGDDQRPMLVAVTGAAGKSVTVSIISHILREQGRDVSIGGQIGVPFLALEKPHRKMVYLLEIPVRQLSLARDFRCNISVVLNVPSDPSPEQMELAIRSLVRVFKSHQPNDTAIIGVDDMMGQKVCTLLRSGRLGLPQIGDIVPISGEATLGQGVYALEGTAYAVRRGKTQALGDFSKAPAFAGSHFGQDAAAAIAVCQHLGLEPSHIMKSLHSYVGLKGRFECLGASGSLLFVDDQCASSIDAAARAISACPDAFWIGGDVNPASISLSRSLSAGGVHGAYLVGDEESTMVTKQGTRINRLNSLSDAMSAAIEDAKAAAANDASIAPVILYSPGLPDNLMRHDHAAFRDLANAMIEGRAAHG